VKLPKLFQNWPSSFDVQTGKQFRDLATHHCVFFRKIIGLAE
jgi:hypothetical protein